MSVQTGWPAAIASPGWGTSRIPRSGQSRVSGTRTSCARVHDRLARRRARVGGARRRGRRQAPARSASRCAANGRTPCAAAIVSSDAVGRGLTSTTQARSPSQTRSTPNRPRRPKAAARCAQMPGRRVGPARRVRPPAAAAATTFPHHVKPRAPSARRPMSCSLTPSSDGGAPVGDRRRRARQPGDALLHDVAAAQPPAAPRPHPRGRRRRAPACAASGARGRRAAGASAAENVSRVGEPGAAQRGAEQRRVADAPQRVRDRSRAACGPRRAARRGRAGSRAPRRRRRASAGIRSAARDELRHPAAAAEVAQDRDARAQAAAGRGRRSGRPRRRRTRRAPRARRACAR